MLSTFLFVYESIMFFFSCISSIQFCLYLMMTIMIIIIYIRMLWLISSSNWCLGLNNVEGHCEMWYMLWIADFRESKWLSMYFVLLGYPCKRTFFSVWNYLLQWLIWKMQITMIFHTNTNVGIPHKVLETMYCFLGWFL